MEKVRCFNDHLCLHWESDDLMWNCWPVSQCACKWPLLGNDLQSLITWLISCYSLSADCCQCANLMITWSDISRPQMLMCLNPWLLLRLAPGPSSNVVFGENEAMAGDWLWSLLVIRSTIERLRHQPRARVVSLGWGDGSGKSVHVIPVSWQLYYLKWNLTIVLLNTKHSLFSPADIQYFVLMFVQQHVVSG